MAIKINVKRTPSGSASAPVEAPVPENATDSVTVDGVASTRPSLNDDDKRLLQNDIKSHSFLSQCVLAASRLSPNYEINLATLILALFENNENALPALTESDKTKLQELARNSTQGKPVLSGEAQIFLVHVYKSNQEAGRTTTREIPMLETMKNLLTQDASWKNQPAALVVQTALNTEASSSRARSKRMSNFDPKTYPILGRGENWSLQHTQKPFPSAHGRQKEVETALVKIRAERACKFVLVGEPGIGKKTIVREMVSSLSPDERLLKLDNALFAGCTNPQTCADKVRQLADEINRAGQDGLQVIVYIDEIHNLPTGVLDKLKEASYSNLKLIGSSTQQEYQANIATNPAVAQSLPSVEVRTLSNEDLRVILGQRAEEYSKKFQIAYDSDVIDFLLNPDIAKFGGNQQPWGSLSLLDQAYSAVRHATHSDPYQLVALKKTITTLEQEIHSATVSGRSETNNHVEKLQKNLTKNKENLEELQKRIEQEKNLLNQEALLLRKLDAGPLEDVVDLTKNMEQQLAQVRAELKRLPQRFFNRHVDKFVVAQNIARDHNLELEALGLGDAANRLSNLEESLSARVKGQTLPVQFVAKIARRFLSGMVAPNKPGGLGLFVGPTGVGKTESALALAELLFGSRNHVVRIDCNELKAPHEVSKWIGAPPGYVGYTDSPQLKNALEKFNGRCVVLLDEVEKAHPEFWDRFMQGLDIGRLTDSAGNTIDFTKAIILMTSNLAASELIRLNRDDNYLENARNLVADAFRACAPRPELFGRVGTDNVIPFAPLELGHQLEILDLRIQEMAKRVRDNEKAGWNVFVSQALREHLVDIGVDPLEGARKMERTLTAHVGDLIIEEINKPTQGFAANDDVLADLRWGSDGKPEIFLTRKVS